MAVSAGQRPRQRETVAVYQEVVLGARTAPVDRAFARFRASFFAWIWLESAIARAPLPGPVLTSSWLGVPDGLGGA